MSDEIKLRTSNYPPAEFSQRLIGTIAGKKPSNGGLSVLDLKEGLRQILKECKHVDDGNPKRKQCDEMLHRLKDVKINSLKKEQLLKILTQLMDGKEGKQQAADQSKIEIEIEDTKVNDQHKKIIRKRETGPLKRLSTASSIDSFFLKNPTQMSDQKAIRSGKLNWWATTKKEKLQILEQPWTLPGFKKPEKFTTQRRLFADWEIKYFNKQVSNGKVWGDARNDPEHPGLEMIVDELSKTVLKPIISIEELKKSGIPQDPLFQKSGITLEDLQYGLDITDIPLHLKTNLGSEMRRRFISGNDKGPLLTTLHKLTPKLVRKLWMNQRKWSSKGNISLERFVSTVARKSIQHLLMDTHYSPALVNLVSTFGPLSDLIIRVHSFYSKGYIRRFFYDWELKWIASQPKIMNEIKKIEPSIKTEKDLIEITRRPYYDISNLDLIRQNKDIWNELVKAGVTMKDLSYGVEFNELRMAGVSNKTAALLHSTFGGLRNLMVFIQNQINKKQGIVKRLKKTVKKIKKNIRQGIKSTMTGKQKGPISSKTAARRLLGKETRRRKIVKGTWTGQPLVNEYVRVTTDKNRRTF